MSTIHGSVSIPENQGDDVFVTDDGHYECAGFSFPVREFHDHREFLAAIEAGYPGPHAPFDFGEAGGDGAREAEPPWAEEYREQSQERALDAYCVFVRLYERWERDAIPADCSRPEEHVIAAVRFLQELKNPDDPRRVGKSIEEIANLAVRCLCWGYWLRPLEALDFLDAPGDPFGDYTCHAREAFGWSGQPDDGSKPRGWRLPPEVKKSHPPRAKADGDREEAAGDRGRLPITITTNEFDVNDRAIAALARDPDIYSRGPWLVTIQRDASSSKLLTRPPETPQSVKMPKASIRERLAKNAEWTKLRKKKAKPKKEGEEVEDTWEEVPAHPPDWSAAAVEVRGSYPGVRGLEGIVETPVLLPDGTILDKPGYDERTGILHEPNGEFPPIPVMITHGEAKAAAKLLMDLVSDFPFKRVDGDRGDAHGAAWLASLLTPLARFAIAGPCPLFMADANTAGSGKSKLFDIPSILVTGREAARLAYPESDEEMRKQIVAVAIAADRLVLIDNIPTGAAFGGAALDAALTGVIMQGRILGHSEQVKLPMKTVWYATGNNLELRGDMLRRVVYFRLDSPEERPEERRGFKIQGDLLEHVKGRRGELVVAALTILRGYFQAGRPENSLTPMDYTAWCRVVRDAIHWATGIDPCATRKELISEDCQSGTLEILIRGWKQLQEGHSGLTASKILKILKEEFMQHSELRDLFLGWSRDKDLPTAGSIGMRLKKFRDRVSNGEKFTSHVEGGCHHWKVEPVSKG